ncbi:MAG: hypothetical protein A2420_01225 [Candidatus Moranbacteria bacterium RIFOXYC1_FULL_44_13]|nr:MAG: hypothetical protein A2420_01225 [Candidatus Moranbacteria bacterium RIFOXYC1_FULL_44_13]
MSALGETAQKLVADHKGLLATDATEESTNKRMEAVGIKPTAELRKQLRELLLTTDGFEKYVGGVILNDEIICQKTSNNKSFPELLTEKNVLVGIKVDKKCHPLANFPGEKIAEGLDGLRDRLVEYKEMDVSFAKFRTVIVISESIPTQICLDSNAEVLGRYAALCQEAGIVPVVEPEVLMDGNHSLQRCEEVTRATLMSTFKHLEDHKVNLSGMILKPNMVLPGKDSIEIVTIEEMVQSTLDVLKRTVPSEVSGITFLSGGQGAEEATKRLNEMNKTGGLPWPLSFSFERALEGPAMEVWQGKAENKGKAQVVFLHRCKMNYLARKGEYTAEAEKEI